MKYLIASSVIALALAGCNAQPSKEVVQQPNVETAPAEIQVMNFVGPMDLTIQLKSADHFETAEMTDNSGKVYHLKRAVSGSGVRLANDQGVSIHFKGSEGIVEFVKNKAITLLKGFVAQT